MRPRLDDFEHEESTSTSQKRSKVGVPQKVNKKTSMKRLFSRTFVENDMHLIWEKMDENGERNGLNTGTEYENWAEKMLSITTSHLCSIINRKHFLSLSMNI